MTVTPWVGGWYRGLSTDTKPDHAALVGWNFLETNTGNIFHHNGTTWVLILGAAKTETLTNKTIDFLSNTLKLPPTAVTTIYKVGSTYYAVDPAVGTIVSSGSSPNTPIADALDRKGLVVLMGAADGLVDYNVAASGFSGFTIQSNTELRIESGARLMAPAGYTGSLIKNDPNGTTQNAWITGHGWIDEQATQSKNWTVIDFTATDPTSFVYHCGAKDFRMTNADTGILLNSNGSWINSNIFSDLNIEYMRNFIDFQGVDGQNLNHNTFDNIQMQAGTGALVGIKNVRGLLNRFKDCSVWDIEFEAPSGKSMTISSAATQTIIDGGRLAYNHFEDNGRLTIIMDRWIPFHHGVHIDQYHHGVHGGANLLKSFRVGKFAYMTQTDTAGTGANGIWDGIVTAVGTPSDDFWGYPYGMRKTWTTGSTSGNQAGIRINKLHTSGQLAPCLFCRLKSNQSIDNIGFIGFTDDASAFRTGATPLANRHGIGLFWSAAAGTFNIMSNDGSATATTSGSIGTLDTQFKSIEIRSLDSPLTDSQAKWQYSFNYGSWTDVTSQIPTNTNLLTVQATTETTTSTAKSFAYNILELRQSA